MSDEKLREYDTSLTGNTKEIGITKISYSKTSLTIKEKVGIAFLVKMEIIAATVLQRGNLSNYSCNLSDGQVDEEFVS